MRLAVINYDVINEWSEVKQNTTVILVKKRGALPLPANSETYEKKLSSVAMRRVCLSDT
jgi:hypothetical protein